MNLLQRFSKKKRKFIWKLKFHADTAAIFNPMNKTLKFKKYYTCTFEKTEQSNF